jgi:hypothetical protein
MTTLLRGREGAIWFGLIEQLIYDFTMAACPRAQYAEAIARRPGNAQTFFWRNSYMLAWDSAPGP